MIMAQQRNDLGRSQWSKGIAASYGNWTGHSKFEASADIADPIVAAGGATFRYGSQGLAVDVPFARDTMPYRHV